MAHVVLLRGANLGKRRFSPAKVAKDLDLANLGAAGTFVARRKVAEATLRRQIAAQLPWEDPDMVILSGDEVRDALEAGAKVPVPAGAIRMGVALPEAPPKTPKLPLVANAKDGAWGTRIEALAGRVALGARRRYSETGTYSMRPIEEGLGTDRGTWRDWTTWEKIGQLLEEDA